MNIFAVHDSRFDMLMGTCMKQCAAYLNFPGTFSFCRVKVSTHCDWNSHLSFPISDVRANLHAHLDLQISGLRRRAIYY